ncbi:MAG: transposase [Chloroflexota bacterium]
MVTETAILVALLGLIDRIPMPSPANRRGRPKTYSDRLFLKALVIMVVRHLPKVHSLLAVLEEREMQPLRDLLVEKGRYPTRRTFERRLRTIPETLPAQIACLGRHLLVLIDPFQDCGPAAAIDSTVLAAKGGVWHKKHREAGIVPHTSIDTEAGWTKSGWHGWVYGWKLHLVTTVAAVWIPLAARLAAANTGDNTEAPALLEELPAEVRAILGDLHYNDPELLRLCEAQGRLLITTKRGKYPHTDDGVEVRRFFHQLRSHAIENFNAQFKAIFNCLGQVPTRGLVPTQRFVLGAVLVYQLALLHRFDSGDDLRVGLKPYLQAA